jgi:hypothetical protein
MYFECKNYAKSVYYDTNQHIFNKIKQLYWLDALNDHADSC